MNIPCAEAIICECSDSPFANLSAEEPDREVYLGDSYGWGWILPNLGSNWTRGSCLGVCKSLISQADADLCAAIQQILCLIADWGVCPEPPCTGVGGGVGPGHTPTDPRRFPATWYPNQLTLYTYLCPDGSPFTYQVAAGMFIAASQELSNRMAASYAERMATTRRVCLGTITSTACAGLPYISVLTATAPSPCTFTLIGGMLPPGLSLVPYTSRSVRITGEPTTPGAYSFAIRATDTLANYMDKTFSIDVLGILNDETMTAGEEATAYTAIFIGDGGTAPYTYEVTTGTLPAGLTLDPSGLLQGTPESGSEGDYTFTIAVQDSTTRRCEKTFYLTIDPEACWIDVLPAGYTSINAMAPTGTSIAYDGGLNFFLYRNRAWTAIAPPAVPEYVTPAGGRYGQGSYPATNQSWYESPTGVDTTLTPLGLLSPQCVANHSEDGWALVQWFDGAAFNINLFSPDTGVVASWGGGVTDARMDAWTSPGPNNHSIILLETGGVFDWRIWYPGVGLRNMGLPGEFSNYSDVASSGHAVIHQSALGLIYRAYFWNGTTSNLIYAPAVGVAVSRINGNDVIVGVHTGGGNFYRYSPTDGVTLLGLPPGAVLGGQIWVTDSDIIVANADNGVWYYNEGAWHPGVELVDDANWTAISQMNAVSHDGYATGLGTYLGVANTPFYAKLCIP